MYGALLADPFWIPLGELKKMTARQQYELYYEPHRKRHKHKEVEEPQDESELRQWLEFHSTMGGMMPWDDEAKRQAWVEENVAKWKREKGLE